MRGEFPDWLLIPGVLLFVGVWGLVVSWFADRAGATSGIASNGRPSAPLPYRVVWRGPPPKEPLEVTPAEATQGSGRELGAEQRYERDDQG